VLKLADMRIAADGAHGENSSISDDALAFGIRRRNEFGVRRVAEQKLPDFGEPAKARDFAVSDAGVAQIH